MIKSIYQSLSLAFFIIFLSFSFSCAHNKTSNETSAHNKANHDQSSNSSNGNYKGCFSKVYAFGDSDTDTGNAHFLGANIQGEIKVNISSRLVVDFLCDALSLPPVCPYKDPSANFKDGVNFAISGSTALSPDYFSRKNVSSLIWKGVPLSFQTQIDWFNKYLNQSKGNGKSTGKFDTDNSLFWIGGMGGSDYTSVLGPSVSLHSLAEISVKNVRKLLQTLLANGAKYVVVQGLPPVGCLPFHMSLCPLHNLDRMGCAATINAGIMTHNQILQWELEKLRKTYPKCSILYADAWNAFLTIAMNTKKYQIEEPFKACCGCGAGKYNFDKNRLCGASGTSVCKDPHKYISWDGIHFTEAMHKHLADLFFNQGFCHPSFDQLVKIKKGM
ncbi:hypothetical protein DH2020_003701 [Rehmannia glutinosa]|uniref:GDSL esterase/lipase n=1 Tax=Rehmannia glutinosa TaxID=99300 RepID=A0ABR0XMD9_REHGL